MPEYRYPTVDIEFLDQQVKNCGKYIRTGKLKIRKRKIYLLAGRRPIHKRIIAIRMLEPGKVNFEQAVALAVKCNFLTALLEWFEIKRKWKGGFYIS